MLIKYTLLLFCFQFSLLLFAGDPKVSLQTGHNYKIVQLGFNRDGKILGSLSEDHTVILWDTKSGRQIMKVNERGIRVNSFAFHPTRKWISRIENSNKIITSDYAGDSIVKILYGRNDSLFRIISLSSKKEFLIIDSSGISRYDDDLSSKKQVFKTSNQEIISEVFLSKDEEKIYLLVKRKNDSKFLMKMGLRCLNANNFQLLDTGTLDFPLHTNITPSSKITFAGENYLFVKEVQLLYKYQILFGNFILSGKYSVSEKWKNHISTLGNLGNQVICGMKNGDIQMYDSQNNKATLTLKGHSDAVTCITTDPTGKYIVSGDENGLILLWNAEDGKLLQPLEGQSESISCFSYNKDRSKMIIGYMNGDLKYWDRLTQEIIKINPESDYLHSALGFQYVITGVSPLQSDSIVEFTATYALSTKKGLFERLTYFKGKWFFRSGKLELEETGNNFEVPVKLLGPETFGKINYHNYEVNPYLKDSSETGWKIFAHKKEVIIQDPQGNKRTLSTNHQTDISVVKLDGNTIITAAWDGTIKEWNLFSEKENICYGISGRSGFFYILPTGNYYCSKTALKFLSFRIEEHIFPFDQFDLLFNRPDLVMDSLSFIEEDVVSQYHRAYIKRVSRVKSKIMTEDLMKNIPIISITETPKNVKTGQYTVSITASDERNHITRIYVMINGVSVSVPEFISSSKITLEVPLRLNYEENYISVYAENTAGLFSLKEEFTILNTEKIKKPNLYLITIGSGTFTENKYNLTYASKDAKDVNSAISKNKMFGKTNTLHFSDAEVKLDIIDQIKTFLKSSNENDYIILFYAGHGVLDKEFNYYLSTAVTNFDSPEKNSLLYTELESTINSFLPRQKLMIIDACHSGEIDKEDIKEIDKNDNIIKGKVKFRGNKNLMGTGALELSKIIFTDIESKNGTTVISSSGGGELSIEGEKWNNGLFTYALLQGLKDKKSDFNHDGILTISELQSFVNKTVYSLSEGMQLPNARSENIRNDFMIRK